VSLVSRVLEIKTELTPTLAVPDSVKLLYRLALRCTEAADLASIVLSTLVHLSKCQELPMLEQKEMMVQLVWHVRNVLGDLRALDLCKAFELCKTLTQIAYRGGTPEHYERIYSVVDEGAYKLEWAMRTVYEQDK